MFDKEVLKTVRRLQNSRLSLMEKQPFYAVLLLHMKFSLDPMCETAYTDGIRIAFCPDFIDTLSDEELEFVLMHEVLHVALDHCGRTSDSYDFDDFNIACDIVVNSNILFSFDMDISRITLKNYGECMHIAPDGKEGYEYSAEEVYKLIQARREEEKKNGLQMEKSDAVSVRIDSGLDDHTYWGSDDAEYSNDALRTAWLQRMIEAAQITEQIYSSRRGKNCGRTPLAAQRMIRKLTEPQTDWRTVLDRFVQEEVTDYSFNPPDRRFQDSLFILPDYNEKDESVKDILFMIDTSASMSDAMITQAYSEIYGAIQQFNGNLQGWLGFFDACVVEPEEFTDEEELQIIRPAGGGGTNFQSIFEYVKEHIDTIKPASIIILTDGYAPWPEESEAMDIPVLWLINNEDSNPPWGKVTRIKSEFANE